MILNAFLPPGKDAVTIYMIITIPGRVARAGRSGCAYSLLSSDEVPYMLDLHLFLGRPLQMSSASKQLVSGGWI